MLPPYYPCTYKLFISRNTYKPIYFETADYGKPCLGERLALMLRRFVKTTGVCPVCRTYVKLNMFEFTCPCYNFDRDVTSAIVILKDRLSLWNVGEKPGDENVSAMVKYFANIPHVSLSMNQELSVRLGWFTWCHSLKKSITME